MKLCVAVPVDNGALTINPNSTPSSTPPSALPAPATFIFSREEGEFEHGPFCFKDTTAYGIVGCGVLAACLCY